jgi:hypothetical protein
MRPSIVLVASVIVLVMGCGGGPAPGAQPQAPAAGSALVNAQSAPSAEAPPAASAVTDSASSAASVPRSGGAARELVNPDASTMVFLYYELAQLPLPIDTWVEEDSRVRFAPAPDKAARRVAVRAELAAAAASVRGVGTIRLTMHANLSDYDPAYGEFTVRALSPSSVVNFDALGQKVAVSFTNGRTAQIWRVPQAEAQAIRDKISYASNVEMDALLRIANVLPGPGGGTLATEVVEYELRETQRGVPLARVQLANR